MKKRSAIIVAIVFMMIGFAAVSTSLIIKGNAKVSENNEDYSVIFTAATLDGEDVYSSVVDDTKKTITFTSKDLMKIGDTSTLAYEVTNNSANYDAEVKVTCVPKEGTTAKYTSIKNELENDATVVKAKESLNGILTIALNKTAMEETTEEYTCTLEFNAIERDTLGEAQPQTFSTDSWETIQKAVKSGNTSKYNVGDTKEINLTNFGTHTIRISNMSACTIETSETACGFVVEFADIVITQPFNRSYTNVGGWKDSELRSYISNTIYRTLPSNLQETIVSTKVISGHGSTSGESNFETYDKLYLLSSEEIYGDFASSSNAKYDTALGTSRQLDYYKNQGVTTTSYAVALKQYNGAADYWWLRMSNSNYTHDFLVVTDAGRWSSSTSERIKGISPAFRIG